jgi:hypothetical protein
VVRPIPHGLLSLIPAGLFLGVGILTLPDYGLTWDEAETFNASSSNLRWLRGIGEPWDATHVLSGYYFVVDTARGFFVEAVTDAFGIQQQLLAQHAFTLCLSSASLALAYLLVAQISNSTRLALYTAGALALLPAFIGHSQNNPKDLPALFSFLLVGCCIVPAARTGHWRWVFASALALGIAWNTRILGLTLVPIYAIWLAWRFPDTHWRRLGIALLGGICIAFSFWPWLWSAPFTNLMEVTERIQVHRLVDFQMMYLGELHSWNEMPWHYRGVHLLVGLPLIYVLALSLAIPAALRTRRNHSSHSDLLSLATIWILVLTLTDILSPYRYDGIRHFLAVLPAFAIVAAVGLFWLHDFLTSRTHRKWLGDATVVACALIALWPLFSTHPYQSAYMNPLARSLAGPHAEEWLELEYWGGAYKAGAQWINENTPRETTVYIPIGESVARHSLRRPAGRWKSFQKHFPLTRRPQYLMFITRSGWYDPAIHEIRRHYKPVHTIQTQDTTLLEIYSNQSIRNHD